MAKNTIDQPEAALVSVVIVVDNHTHAGRPVEKGATIQVPAETAAWLRENNIAEA